MPSPCDHTSVGILVEREGLVLLIERKRFPFGYALPAGHVDGNTSFEAAAVQELYEETGLRASHLDLIASGRKENPCRREGGIWHLWKIYRAVTSGDVVPSPDETKRFGWYTRDEIKTLANRTEEYRAKRISEADWEALPGLEPLMYDWFTELHLI